MARTFKFIADTNNGVREVDSLEEYEGLEIVDEDTFLERLGTLSDDEFIGAELEETTILKLIVMDYMTR